MKETLAQWLEEKEVIEVDVATLGQCYVHHSLLPLLASGAKSTCVAFLSPFDPVVWDRKRASELFDFEYRLECYTGSEASVRLLCPANFAQGRAERAAGCANAA